MTDGELLLRAILDQPKEETPRLVYADWLEENGQPERAEFIRVQVEIAGWGTTPPADAEEWVRRERELLWGHGLKWALPATEVHHSGPTGVGPSAGHILGFFSRGFLSHVTCSWPDWRAHADAILAAQPVERVRLTTWPYLNLYDPRDERGRSPAYPYREWFLLSPERRVSGIHGTGDTDTGTRLRLLKLEWPRIKFGLPSERVTVTFRGVPIQYVDHLGDQPESLRDWWENHTQVHTQ
jgi:uncharacterized protein (TIGR02996 family)